MYYKYFGLDGPPFAAASSPAVLFLSAGHREGLAALEWGLREPSGFTMLVGEIGTGKTTLIHSLLANRAQGIRVAFVTNPTLSFDEILRLIVTQLGIKADAMSKLQMLQALDALLAGLRPHESVALIIDEAQDLADETLEELRLLSNPQSPGERPLQIVLVGQLEFARRLERPELRQLNQRIGARALLPALRSEEVRDYIEYRLRAHGGNVGTLFKRAALRDLAQLSQGIPRRINVLCHNALLLAYAAQSRRVEAEHVREAGRDYDHLLSDPPPSSASPGRGGWLLRGAAFAGLVAALLGLSYLVIPGTLSKPEPAVYGRIASNHRDRDQVPAAGAGAHHSKPVSKAAMPSNMGADADPVTHADANPAGQEIIKVAVPVPAAAVNRTLPSSADPATPMSPPVISEHAGVNYLASASAPKSVHPALPAPDPVSANPPAPEAAQSSVVVRPGDTLSKIVLQHFGGQGDDLRQQIALLVKANPNIVNANRIYPGQIIRLQETKR